MNELINNENYGNNVGRGSLSRSEVKVWIEKVIRCSAMSQCDFSFRGYLEYTRAWLVGLIKRGEGSLSEKVLDGYRLELEVLDKMLTVV